MSTAIRIALLAGAVFMFLYVWIGVRKARFRAQETFFWLLVTFIFVLLSIFPGVAVWVGNILGVQSTVNLVYLVVIFLLLVKIFIMDRKLAKTEHQITRMTQKLAIDRLTGEEEDRKPDEIH